MMGVAELTKAQRAAILAMPGRTPCRLGDTIVQTKHWGTPTELGISGRTLWSMNGVTVLADDHFGGCGPILVTYDESYKRRYWTLTDLGIEVRAYLQSQEPYP